ncbi:MAG: sodium:proton antiporter NhaD [Bacteroidetes bacterium]|nr:sodium:proton antiporter NhaD [Bacteroidota bacterium]
MFYVMIGIFIVGYVLIALEHPIKVNKSATALLLGVVLWTSMVIAGESILINPTEFKHYLEGIAGGDFLGWLVHKELLHHLGEISEILFFLLGAMTIVELVDSYQGFGIITDKIQTTKRAKLLWVTSILTFFMSAVLDNLTTSIVMVALLRKLIADKKDRWFFAGMVIVAANAGGAWSPIGDVTTIMLWIAGKVTTLNIIKMTILPSIVSLVVPLLILSLTLKGTVKRPAQSQKSHHGLDIPKIQSNAIFFIGVGGLLFVPVFKSYTHLPPYLGMLFSLGVLWTITEILNRNNHHNENSRYLTVAGVLRKVDVPSVLFFLGILLAVAGLATAGHLELLADTLRTHVGNLYVINIIIGVLSAVVDNVPLVAGAMGMYNFPPDHYFWEFLAYCAGTGGSILIIGSAAGVAVMGMEKIDFIWYLRKISLLALIGYLAGAGVYILQEESGILHKKHVEAAYVVNVNDNKDIINYLTAHEFYQKPETRESHEPMESHLDGNYIHFIKFNDEANGETYLGYNCKTITDGNEIWDGKLLKGKLEVKKISEGEVLLNVLQKTFRLDDQGRLFELQDAGEGMKLEVEWGKKVFEE